MDTTDVVKLTIWANTGLIVMARILGDLAAPINQATVGAITGKVMDLESEAEISTLTVDPTSTIFDALQTADPRWNVDNKGYNFLHTVPASCFQIPNVTYQVGYYFTPLSGQPFGFAVQPRTKKLLP